MLAFLSVWLLLNACSPPRPLTSLPFLSADIALTRLAARLEAANYLHPIQSHASPFQKRHWHQDVCGQSVKETLSCSELLNLTVSWITPTGSKHWHENQWAHLRVTGGGASSDRFFMADESQRFTFPQPSAIRPANRPVAPPATSWFQSTNRCGCLEVNEQQLAAIWTKVKLRSYVQSL